MITRLNIAQPAWLAGVVAAHVQPDGDDGRMAEVLALATANVRRQSGGPFAAAVYDEVTGERLACAVNVVVPSHCALAHAETMALALAQQAVGSHTLAGRRCVLVTSAEPCAMCLGAITWSGVLRVVFAATRADVEATGFDEGPRPARWKAALAGRGIAVSGPLRRAAGRRVLQDYRSGGGALYNARATDNGR